MSNPNPNKSGLRAPWRKGESGNPHGRCKSGFDSLSKSSRQQLRDSFGRQIFQALNDGLESENEKVRVMTALSLLDHITPRIKPTDDEKLTFPNCPTKTGRLLANC